MIHATENTVISTKVSDRFPNGRYRHGLGACLRDESGRRIQDGPIVPGPWAYAYGLAVCITANPEMSSGAEAERGRAAGTEHVVEDGDLIELNGDFYEVETYRNAEFVRLHRMTVEFSEAHGQRLVRSETDRISRLHQYQIDAEAQA